MGITRVWVPGEPAGDPLHVSMWGPLRVRDEASGRTVTLDGSAGKMGILEMPGGGGPAYVPAVRGELVSMSGGVATVKLKGATILTKILVPWQIEHWPGAAA